jgi:hypothetical protein
VPTSSRGREGLMNLIKSLPPNLKYEAFGVAVVPWRRVSAGGGSPRRARTDRNVNVVPRIAGP